MGPPGAGKGTLGPRLSTAFGVPLIITGDLMREAARRSDALGLKIRSFVDAGELVPDSVVTQVITSAIERPDVVAGGFILDGFPRTLPQAESLSQILAERARKLDLVLVLEIDEQTAVERLALRRQCPQCGAVYHQRFFPPKQAERCDRCGSGLVQRSDDHPEIIRQRLAVYYQQTAPVIEYYAARGLLGHIRATHSPEGVFQSAMAIIRKRVPAHQPVAG
ncbi:MAG: adenylate kinase family protein [bacterium JZ-2024 1]